MREKSDETKVKESRCRENERKMVIMRIRNRGERELKRVEIEKMSER